MTSYSTTLLQKLADLALKVGLDLQPGQRLLILTTLDCAPMAREVTGCAYRMGARLVDVMWDDEVLHSLRFRHAPADSFHEYPTWRTNGVMECLKRGDAYLRIYSLDPNLLQGYATDQVAAHVQAEASYIRPVYDYRAAAGIPWSVITFPAPGWAAAVFPELPPARQEEALWESLVSLYRLEASAPTEEWRRHLDDLSARAASLNGRRFSALKYSGPGTDLTVGLAPGHIWLGGWNPGRDGSCFVPNLPTEEVFTMPHHSRVEGTVRLTKPFVQPGIVVEDVTFTFREGRVVQASAGKGESLLHRVLDTDEGARRLGEVALVPHSSPISQSGRTFWNPLLDENASCHLALGNAYRITLAGGKNLSPDEFAAAGGNLSSHHIDFMVGSGQLDVDGIREDGTVEPVLRGGEWAFEV
jgi:aminopeptidase